MLSAVPGAAWSQEPGFQVFAEAATNGSVLIIIKVDILEPNPGDAVIQITGPTTPILEQIPISEAGNYPFMTPPIDPGNYTVHVTYGDVQIDTPVHVIEPAPDPEPDLLATPAPKPPSEPTSETVAEPTPEWQNPNLIFLFAAAAILSSVAVIAIRRGAKTESDSQTQRQGADGEAIQSSAIQEPDMSHAPEPEPPGHDQTPSRPKSAAPPPKTAAEQDAAEQAPTASETVPPPTSPPPAMTSSELKATAAKGGRLTHLGVEAQKKRMRELISGGILIPDTNVCIDHFLRAASESGILDRQTRTALRSKRTNTADDVIHEGIGAAVREGRIRIPYEVARSESGRIIGRRTTSEDKIKDSTGILRRNGLYGLVAGKRQVLKPAPEEDVDRIRAMYDRFRTDPQTKQIAKNLNVRNSPDWPGSADIRTLASAAVLARDHNAVRLLTLDSNLTAFADQIRKEQNVVVVSGNPYIRIGDAQYDDGKYRLAEEHYERGAGLSDSEYAAYKFALALNKNGKVEESRKVGERVGLGPKALSFFRKAALLMEWGDLPEAFATKAKAERIGKSESGAQGTGRRSGEDY